MISGLLSASIVYLIYRISVWVYLTFYRSLEFLQNYHGVDGKSWALITGATDGIGLGYAKVLARAGFNLVLLGRNPEKLQKVCKELKEAFPGVSIKAIISEASDLSQQNFDGIFDEAKALDLSMLVNNVGIGQGPKLIDEMNPEQIQNIINVNCVYPTLLTSKLMPVLQKRKGPKAILNLSSISALVGSANLPLYAATKAFNRSFSQNLAMTSAISGIQVLTVIPGLVVSNMTKMSENAICCTAEECAEGSLRSLGWRTEVVPHYKHMLVVWPLIVLQAILPNALYSSLMMAWMRSLTRKNKD